MSKQYRHLTEEDRLLLGSMLDKRYSKSKIAKLLGVDRSTIYREIKHNRLSRLLDKRIYYIGWMAHRRYLERRKRPLKLLLDKPLRHYVHNKLGLGWSPWQIEGRLKREHDGKCMISHETIYRYIYSDGSRRNCFYKKLRRRH